MTQLLHKEVSAQVVKHGDLRACLAEGKVDVAWLSAGQYVDASARAKVEPAARLLRGGMPFYRSALFARRGTVKSIEALRGKRLAFVSERSNAGDLFARPILVASGFTDSDLRGAQFFAHHPAVHPTA